MDPTLRPEDLLPREHYRPSCTGCSHWDGPQNNPCRKNNVLSPAGDHTPVCDYDSKLYYQQHNDAAAGIRAYYMHDARLSKYN